LPGLSRQWHSTAAKPTAVMAAAARVVGISRPHQRSSQSGK
jgi:hypothetical protein